MRPFGLLPHDAVPVHGLGQMEALLKAVQARKLDRIAAAYAVVAWILVQAASIGLPAFDLPGWTLRSFIVFALAGFPVVLALAWLAAPHLGWTEVPHQPLAGKRLASLAAVALVLIFSAAEIAYRFGPTPAVPNRAKQQIEAQAAPAPPPNSIAVLPFDNMSGDAGKAYFSDGISEEILNDLANAPSLRVAARASSFAFRGTRTGIQTIARVLGVRSILQGSVRESGQHIRITASLVNAANGYVLWSSDFDRNLTDVLAVQEDIARAITGALTSQLAPSRLRGGKNGIAAMNPDAYRAYLEGQYYLGPRTAEGVSKAIPLFERAVALQPDFAEAYAALGRAYLNVWDNSPKQRSLATAAQAALARARSLAPDNLNALATHLDLSFHLLDWQAAAVDAARLQTINPGSAIVLHEMFRYYQLMGFPQRALDSAQAAEKLNPLSISDRLNIVAALLHMARFPEAAATAEDALSLHHEQPIIQSMLCAAYAQSGRLDDARRIAEELAAIPDPGDAQECQFFVAKGGNDRAGAETIMDALAGKYPDGDLSAEDIGDNYAIAGLYPKALTWLNRAYDNKEFALFTVPFDRAIDKKFFDLPAWKTLWAKPLARDWQAAHDRLSASLSVSSATVK